MKARAVPLAFASARFACWWIALDVSRRFGMAPRLLYGWFYDAVTSLLAMVGEGTTFMNYGYADETVAPAEDPASATSLALYRRTVTAAGSVNVEGRDLLEVGAGLGGGAAWLARNLAPGSVTGVDLSRSAVERCRARHLPSPGLRFEPGDAQALEFADGSFDLVLSVESSHTYPDFGRFVAEAHRVLRPGGYLMLTDFRAAGRIAALRESLSGVSFEIVDFEDVTASVVGALRLSSAVKEERIAALRLPRAMARQMAYFAGLVGSEKFSRFERRDDVYVRLAARKGS